MHPELAYLLRCAGDRAVIERGTRHQKIKVDGRLVAILPLDNRRREREARSEQNVLAQVRRALKGDVR